MQEARENPESVGGNDASQRGQRSAYAVQCIRDMIISDELPAGGKISERLITERLGISRTPLREALKILEVEGLVQISPNRGAVVVKLSRSDVEAVIEMLIGMELQAAELACQRATEEQIAHAEELHAQMAEAYRAGKLLEYFNLNQAIHEQIFECAQNPALLRVYRAESSRIRRYRFVSNREASRWPRALQEHEQILDALKRREGAILREVLRAHHWNGWKATSAVLGADLQ